MSIAPEMAANLLLARFPQSVRERLLSRLEAVPLPAGHVVYEAQSSMESAYFPISGVLSAVVVMLDGNMIEVATVGFEGGVGVGTTLTGTLSTHRVFAQVAGHGLRIPCELINQEVDRDPAMRQCLIDYLTAFHAQVSQSVACNGLHTLSQRCCRWLLMTHDRVHSDQFELTHEFLSVMLGVRRSTVTEALQALQDKELISYSRGRILVKNRIGLEASSCECYSVVQQQYKALLPRGSSLL